MNSLRLYSKFEISKIVILLFVLWYPISRIVFTQNYNLLKFSTLAFSVSLIILSLLSKRFSLGFNKNHSLGWIVLLFAFSTFIGSLHAHDILESFDQWSKLLLSMLMCIAVSSFRFKESQLYTILLTFSAAFTVLCIVSIIDYLGIQEVPGFNESVSSMTGDGSAALIITDISGPYLQRSQFSANLAVCFPISLFYVAKADRHKVFWIFMCVILVGTTVITFSRMVYVSLVFSILFFAWYRVYSLKFYIGTFVAFLLIISLLNNQILNYISLGYESLQDRFMQVEHGHAGDTWRYDALIMTLDDFKSRPFGMGFNKLWSESMGRYANPHSLFTSYLRAGGVFALSLYLFLLYKVVKQVRYRNSYPVVLPLICCVLSLMTYAVTHLATSIIMWLFIGILFSVNARQQYETK